MFLIEGGMSFDTRNAVANAKTFQRELKNTGKVAQDVSKQGANLEGSFSGLGNQRTRSAIKNLASSLANAKDATEATADAARALQTAFVKSIGGTALIAGAGALANVVRDVGAKIGGAADESARAMASLKGFAQSLEEGRQRSDALSQSADNTLKTLEGLKNAGIFQSGVFKLFGGDQVLQDLEEATRGAAQAEFGAGAAAERRTAEGRLGMTPEQIAADKRKQEEQKRLKEARAKGGPRAEADVARTIAAENRQAELQKGEESEKKFDQDVADNARKIAEMRKSAEDKIRDARLDALTPAARITELDKEAAAIKEKIAEITRTGIYGTEEKRKPQLEELLSLEQKSLDIASKKAKALKEQDQEAGKILSKEAQAISDKYALPSEKMTPEQKKEKEVKLGEAQRKRNLDRERAEAQAEMRRAREAQQRNEFEEQLRKFFGAGTWSSIPDNIKNQMLISGVSNQHLAMINRNTAPSGGGGGGYSMQGTRFGRPKSGIGMERPEGYVPPPSGVDVLFSENRGGRANLGGSRDRGNARSVMRGKPSTVSADNPYKPTRIRGQSSNGDLASAIQALADKIPAAVPQ